VRGAVVNNRFKATYLKLVEKPVKEANKKNGK
jgi:hypothetical protein